MIPETVPEDLTTGALGQNRACCCPAKPVVRVIIPPSPARPHPTDLLLCGHHFRASRDSLRRTQATVRDLEGLPGAPSAVLLDEAANAA